MARRLFNGRRFSENGWPYVDEGSCRWIIVPGTKVSLQIQDGPPLYLIRAWAADWNAYVEPLRDEDSACFTLGNSVATSNHPGGTACDLNWKSHPFEVEAVRGHGGCGFTAEQIATIDEMDEFYEGLMFWANNWRTPKDAMHSQLGYNTYDQDNDRPFPKVLDFIARKIRPDGFSTFRRGGTSGVPRPASGAAQILADAAGLTRAKAEQILPQVRQGLIDSQCNTISRIAFWLAQIGHESDRFNATEEYAKNGRYAPYIGRTWIQITWQSNYAKFGEWCYDKGLVAYPNFFVDNPKELANLEWAGLGPAWYWTVEREEINSLCDRNDFREVTIQINGGLTNYDDRLELLQLASAQGDKLLALVDGEGESDIMAGITRGDWDALVSKVDAMKAQLTDPIHSLSGYRDAGEPDIENQRQVIRNGDLMKHHRYVEESAIELGDFDSIRRIIRSARQEGEDRSPEFVRRAQNALKRLETENEAALTAYLNSKGVTV